MREMGEARPARALGTKIGNLGFFFLTGSHIYKFNQSRAHIPQKNLSFILKAMSGLWRLLSQGVT